MTIDLSFEGQKSCIVLNNPPHNILNIKGMRELISAIDEVEKNQGIKVLLLRAEGKSFCAGVDVKEHLPDTVEEMIHTFDRLCQRLYSLSIPTLCVVHGYVFGGGLEFAVMCDMVFAEEDAQFGQPEIKLAVFPPVAAGYYSCLIGAKRTNELLLTGKTISAREALEYGLINKVFPKGKLLEEVNKVADTICAHSRAALLLLKRALRKGQVDVFQYCMSDINRLYLEELMKTEDAKEGLLSFIEKRKPVFKDR
jgi:cyclohexa-1,5-dienecarbonyl-CoA hydratase